MKREINRSPIPENSIVNNDSSASLAGYDNHQKLKGKLNSR